MGQEPNTTIGQHFRRCVTPCHICRRLVKYCHIFRMLVNTFQLYSRSDNPFYLFKIQVTYFIIEVNDGQNNSLQVKGTKKEGMYVIIL